MKDAFADLFKKHEAKVNAERDKQDEARKAAAEWDAQAMLRFQEVVDPVFVESAEELRQRGCEASAVVSDAKSGRYPILHFTPPSPRKYAFPGSLSIQSNGKRQVIARRNIYYPNGEESHHVVRGLQKALGEPSAGERTLEQVTDDWVRELVRAFVDDVLSASRGKPK